MKRRLILERLYKIPANWRACISNSKTARCGGNDETLSIFFLCDLSKSSLPSFQQVRAR
jgi:hypothetical protein